MLGVALSQSPDHGAVTEWKRVICSAPKVSISTLQSSCDFRSTAWERTFCEDRGISSEEMELEWRRRCWNAEWGVGMAKSGGQISVTRLLEKLRDPM